MAKDEQLLEACKLAYRKHVLDDPEVGWEELGDALYVALAGAMGDGEFVKWLDAVSPKSKPIV